MNFITQNPFRILGLSIDSTEKDKARNFAKAKAFLAAKKTVLFESDLPLAVEVERTMESLQEASSQIQQVSGRLKYAHLWFWEGNPVDSKAFQLLRSGNHEDGVSLLLRNSDGKEISARNYSSFRNLALYYLAMLGPGMSFNKALAENGLRFIGRFFKSDYFDQYSRIAVGDGYPGRKAMVEDLCVVIFKPFKLWVNTGKVNSDELINWIEEFPEDIKKSVKNSFIAKPISDITEEINKSEATLDEGDKYGYYAGKKLYENAAPVLKRLEGLLGRSDYRYEASAEDVAKQMRRCCFAFWEAEMESDESDPGTRCLYLSERAYSLCPFGSFGETLKKDVDQIKEWNQGAAERNKKEKAKDDIEYIVGCIDELQNLSGRAQLSHCESVVEGAEPVLKRIRGLLGHDAEIVTKMSTALASHIVGCLINFTNNYANNASGYQRVSSLMGKIRNWNLESDFRAHLEENYLVIRQNASLASQVEERRSSGGSGCLVAVVAVFVIYLFFNWFGSGDSSGSNFQTTIPYNGTPLHQAALIDEKRVEKIIRDGADVNAKDDNGETPLDWAIELDMDETANMLRRYGGTATKKAQAASSYSSPSTGRKSQSTKLSSTPSSRRSSLPPQATPRHGKVFEVTGNQIAPFELKVPGAGSNYYVKLEDWYTGQTKMAFFVRGSNRNVNIDVPVGTYKLKYASGETWFGKADLFGRYTSYNQANSKLKFEIIGNQISGHTVELTKRVNGNLHTSTLSSSKF